MLMDFLNEADLRRMAGKQSFVRGEDYFTGGRVKDISADAEMLTATVVGARRYRVKLWIAAERIEHSCTCPMGDDGNFCKHCVAAALAFRAERNDRAKAQLKPTERGVTMQDVRAMLLQQDHESVVAMILDWAKAEDRLRERLLLAAAKQSKRGVNLATFRHAIDAALDQDDFIGYHEMSSYAYAADEVIERIEELRRDGHAEAAIELSEYALKAAERAMHSMDDSDGYMRDILDRLQGIHLQACLAAKSDPVALAQKLFTWEMQSEWEIFLGAAGTYAKVLGPGGLEAYRTLAEEEWAKVPARSPGSRESEAYGRRFRITHMMETLARLSGDVEALVTVMSRDLSLAYSFLRIAETYKEAGQREKALEWGERGLRAFPNHTDSRLREFVAEEYHRRKRHQDAGRLIWANFLDRPELEEYKDLAKHAKRTGDWNTWRERALEEIRSRIAAAKKRGSQPSWFPPGYDEGRGHSLLVRIFLHEKDVENAWREAKEGGCSAQLWLELARLRESEHPEDAVPIYLGRVEPLLAQKNNAAYADAVTLLRRTGTLMTRLGQQEDFVNHLTLLRAKHKPKRNFIKLLDSAKL